MRPSPRARECARGRSRRSKTPSSNWRGRAGSPEGSARALRNASREQAESTVGVPRSRVCVFCEMVNGRAPAHVVLEDDVCFGFLDTKPVFLGHTLIVPRTHREALADLRPEELAPLLLSAQRVSRALGEALGAQGTFVALNDRISQSVPHVHLHVVPRRKGDGLRGFFWPRVKYTTLDEAAAIASELRSALTRAAIR